MYTLLYFFLFSFGCSGSLLLYVGFFQLQRAGGCSSCVGTGFSLWLLLLQSTGSRCMGFSSCSMQAQQLRLAGSWAPELPQLWHRGLLAVARGPQNADSVVVMHGLVALRHVKSPWTSDCTYMPCIGRQTLIYCTTKEVLIFYRSIYYKTFVIQRKTFFKVELPLVNTSILVTLKTCIGNKILFSLKRKQGP